MLGEIKQPLTLIANCDDFIDSQDWNRRDFMFERITFDPKVMGGRACIRGMRIPVSLVVNLIANGMKEEEILTEYPDLEIEDIRHALMYVA